MDLFDSLLSSCDGESSVDLGRWTPHFNRDDFENLRLILNRVELDRDTRIVYPEDDLIFRVYKETAPEDVRVVILGQDPYYTSGQAIGRAFACGAYLSPSLKIIKDAIDPNDFDEFELGNKFDITLQHWVDQGVFLLNTALTVISGKPGSHATIGWDRFINSTIKIINNNDFVVWLLWGAEARGYFSKISCKHKILLADHPVYAERMHTTWECNHFEEVNKIFKRRSRQIIKWT